jgi:hypothetical protein
MRDVSARLRLAERMKAVADKLANVPESCATPAR